MTVRFDTKIAVVLRADLPAWQKLNVTAFLASGVAATSPEAIGEHYADADGTKYLPMFGQPVLVFAAESSELDRTLERALTREIQPAVFTADLFATGHDEANRAAVAAVPRAGLDLVGLAFRGPRNDVDKITKGLRLHG
ncbi:MAG TPA: DUF2000 domain-containing protein [Jatrophihabitans sp.]|jgi:hypothetical protein|nr:DUF2000 domain-containing protein [Jatrophihabitans sp.]